MFTGSTDNKEALIKYLEIFHWKTFKPIFPVLEYLKSKWKILICFLTKTKYKLYRPGVNRNWSSLYGKDVNVCLILQWFASRLFIIKNIWGFFWPQMIIGYATSDDDKYELNFENLFLAHKSLYNGTSIEKFDTEIWLIKSRANRRQ